LLIRIRDPEQQKVFNIVTGPDTSTFLPT